MTGLASDTAMVMAAGKGTRMRPLTDDRPKPMVEVAGKPLIDHALDKLGDAGITRAVVNVHYFADQLEVYLRNRSNPAITVSDERAELLETGGGMVLAQGYLPDPFFCLNSDNIWVDGDCTAFETLSRFWDSTTMDALLLLVPHTNAANFTGAGDFFLDGAGRLTRRGDADHAPFIYTGIQLVSHRLLRDAPKGKFSTNVLWTRALEEGRLFGVPFDGRWFEVGTPDAIHPTEVALASG